MNHNNVISLPVGATALIAHMRVNLVAGLVVPATDVNFIGHVLQDTVAGGTADIAYKFGSAYHYAIANGVINNGAGIGGDVDGRIVTGGTEGIALSAASAAGSIIRVIYTSAAAA